MRDALRLDNKVAIITGGSGGIGQATAELLVARGARVAIADITFDRAKEVAARFGDAGIAVALDLADEQSIVDAVAAVVGHFGRLDILHNNAAQSNPAILSEDGPIGEMRTAIWDSIFAVNCRGTMIITRESMPHLIATRGAIVNTVSALGLQGHIRQTAYGASKAAIIQLTRGIATAYGRKGVRCNAVAPGLILTQTVINDFPAEWRKLAEDEVLRDRAGAPEDIAQAVAFLASEAAANITGQTLTSDGGASIHVPGFAAYNQAFAV